MYVSAIVFAIVQVFCCFLLCKHAPMHAVTTGIAVVRALL